MNPEEKVSKSEFHCLSLSQSTNVKGNNLSANSRTGSEMWIYFLNEYVNYLCIDFYCVGKWEMHKELSAQAPADTLH